ncbi:MAG: hypothetical protein ACKVT0_12545, partial [Planctomycetaceae bacterium]
PAAAGVEAGMNVVDSSLLTRGSDDTPSAAVSSDDLPVEARKPGGPFDSSAAEQTTVMSKVRSLIARNAGVVPDENEPKTKTPLLFDHPDLPVDLAQKFAEGKEGVSTKSGSTKSTKPTDSKSADDDDSDDDPGETVATIPVADPADGTKSGVNNSSNSETPRNKGTSAKESKPERTTDKGKLSPEIELAPFVIIDAQGVPKKNFRTLEAACQDAADGSVIELRFSGVQQVKPIKISEKTITIRATQGFRPTLEFVPESIPGQGDLTKMVTVTNGSLSFFDVHLLMKIDNQFVSDQWSLFSLQAIRQLSLDRVLVTVDNPDRKTAIVCEIQPPPSGNMPNMNMMNKRPAREPYQVELNHCLVRGTSRLFDVKTTEPGRFSLLDSAVALEGHLMQVWGDPVKAAEGQRLELKLEHVTLMLGESLVRVDSGNQFPLELLPIFVTARNSLFALSKGQSLIAMDGSTAVSDFQRQFRWNGEKNFHNQTETFWSIHSTQGLSERRSFNFEDWQRAGSSVIDVGVRNDPVLWKTDWHLKRFVELTPADLELLPDPQRNPALLGAANGGAVGADLFELPADDSVDTESIEAPL